MWNKKNATTSKHPPSYPNEMLVKICSSNFYSPLVDLLPKHASVLEVGIFSGNNARFFLENGFDVTGSEINYDLIQLCKENLQKFNYKIPRLVLGTNTNLPFDSDEFDLLVSINTIHYSSNDINKAICEFARVLKPSGWAIIETAGQNHFAVRSSTRKSENNYLWQADGFRHGEIMGFFDSSNHFKLKLLETFKEVYIYNRKEDYPDKTLEFYVAVCKK